jgi:hypothetical protein
MSKLIKFADRTKPVMIVECVDEDDFSLLELGQQYEAYTDGNYTRIPNVSYEDRDYGFYPKQFKVVFGKPPTALTGEVDYYPYMLTLKGSGTHYRWNVMLPNGYSKCFETKEEAHDEIIRLKEVV